MKNKTKYTHKEMPINLIDQLPDGYCCVGWGGEWMHRMIGGKGSMAIQPLFQDDSWTAGGYACLNENFLYALPVDSPLLSKLFLGRIMPMREWFKMLPNGYRQRALAQTDEGDGGPSCSLRLAFDCGLIWANTKEKHGFWRNVRDWTVDPSENKLPPLPVAKDDQGMKVTFPAFNAGKTQAALHEAEKEIAKLAEPDRKPTPTIDSREEWQSKRIAALVSAIHERVEQGHGMDNCFVKWVAELNDYVSDHVNQ